MELLFATANEHKIQEVKALFTGTSLEIKGLPELGYERELVENSNTLEGNSAQKAWFAYNKFKTDCFAEDTGLEVDALNGAPGLLSARYAGDNKDPQANILKVLNQLEGRNDREAQFRTVITLIIHRIEHNFEGICRGRIAEKPSGTKGFGYDPIFIPDGYDITFAEMDIEEKNKISHRARAFQLMVAFMKEQYAHLTN